MFVSCSVLGGLASTKGVDDNQLLEKQVATLEDIERAGYDYVEVYHGNQPPWFGKIIAERLEILKLNAYSIHLPKDTLEMKRVDFDSMQDRLASFIQQTGIEVVVIHPPESSEYGLQNWYSRLDSLMEMAEKIGCVICPEIIPNTRDLVLESIQTYSKRAIGVTVDTEHMHILGSNIHDMIDYIGEAIQNVHFRDSDGNLVNQDGTRNFLPLGKGNIDFLGVVRTLECNGYKKALTIELGPHDFASEVTKAREYVQRCLQMI